MDGTVAKHALTVFSKSYCGFSKRAKDLLDGMLYEEDDMHVVELDQRDDGPALQDYLQTLTGGRTVPRVFVGGKFVGGATEVQALHDAGKLVPLLEAAGVEVDEDLPEEDYDEDDYNYAEEL